MGPAGVLGYEAIELQNWLICFVCTSEELRVVVVNLVDWMSKYRLPWAAYHTLMGCCLVDLGKSPRVRSVRIG